MSFDLGLAILSPTVHYDFFVSPLSTGRTSQRTKAAHGPFSLQEAKTLVLLRGFDWKCGHDNSVEGYWGAPPTPLSWSDWEDQTLLLEGAKAESSGAWRFFTNKGWRVFAVDTLDTSGDASSEGNALVTKKYLEQQGVPLGTHMVVLGHSQGGLTGRAFVKLYGASTYPVDRLVTLDSPQLGGDHYGTNLPFCTSKLTQHFLLDWNQKGPYQLTSSEGQKVFMLTSINSDTGADTSAGLDVVDSRSGLYMPSVGGGIGGKGITLDTYKKELEYRKDLGPGGKLAKLSDATKTVSAFLQEFLSSFESTNAVPRSHRWIQFGLEHGDVTDPMHSKYDGWSQFVAPAVEGALDDGSTSSGQAGLRTNADDVTGPSFDLNSYVPSPVVLAGTLSSSPRVGYSIIGWLNWPVPGNHYVSNYRSPDASPFEIEASAARGARSSADAATPPQIVVWEVEAVVGGSVTVGVSAPAGGNPTLTIGPENGGPAADAVVLSNSGPLPGGAAGEHLWLGRWEVKVPSGTYVGQARTADGGVSADLRTVWVAEQTARFDGAISDAARNDAAGAGSTATRLEFEIPVTVIREGRFSIQGVLKDTDGEEIWSFRTPGLTLSVGPATVSAVIPDTVLREQGGSGPYRLSGLTLFDEGQGMSVDKATGEYVTREYPLGTFGIGCTVPSITSQPRSVTTSLSGGPAQNEVLLSVTSAGTKPLKVQWYLGEGTASPIPDGQGMQIRVSATAPTRKYWARVTNGCGSADSTIGAVGPSLALERLVPIVLDVDTGSAHYRSDLTLTNPATVPVTVTLGYTPSMGSREGLGAVTIGLEPGEQRTISDVISYLRSRGLAIPASGTGSSQGGSLAVAFDGLPTEYLPGVMVRTASDVVAPQPEGTAGLAYGGQDGRGAITDRARICGLRSNEADRSNVAIVNAGSEPVTVKVTAYSGSGDGRRVVVSDSVTVPALGWIQYSGVLQAAGIENGWVTVERVSQSGSFTAYGVINDNRTNDGSFVDPVAAAAAGDRLTIPVIVETPAFRSELVLTNTSGNNVMMTLEYLESITPVLGEGGMVSVGLGPFEQKIVPEVVDFLRRNGTRIGAEGTASYGGSVRIRVTGASLSDVFAGARTAAQSPAGGQFGLFTPAVPEGAGATAEAYLYGLRADEMNRSNVAVVNAGADGSGTVTLSLQAFDGDAGGLAKGAPTVVALAPGAWTQLSGYLAENGIRNGWVKVTRLAGSAPWIAYGVINDGGNPGERTGDGAYVPMTTFGPQ